MLRVINVCMYVCTVCMYDKEYSNDEQNDDESNADSEDDDNDF